MCYAVIAAIGIHMSDHKQQVLMALEAARARIDSEDWHGECVCLHRTLGRCPCLEEHQELLTQLDTAIKTMQTV
jgi:hypothetical protein